jgi:hypothetical protein
LTNPQQLWSYPAFISLVCALIWSPKGLSIEVADLYQASVTISNQSREARNTSQKDAFRKVLVKVSGTYQVLDNPEVKKAIRKAGQYLREFEFIRNDENQMRLEAKFDQVKINRLLRSESLPIWGKRRPSILLWMAVEDPDTAIRNVISKESYSHLMARIQKASDDRGLPIVFPLYDIEDNQKVSVSDVWGHFYQHIVQFSRRYKSDATVISRFWHEVDTQETDTIEPNVHVPQALEDKNWKLEWRLYETDALVEIKTITGNLNQVLDQLVHTMADRYATQYAVDSSSLDSGNRIILTVSNVGDIQNLIEAEKLLLSFSAVSDVLLKTVNDEIAEFEILLLGESLDLLQGLELEQHFKKIFDPLADTDESQPLEFRWIP